MARVPSEDAVTILMYHGIVATPLAVPDWCFISVESFTEQIDYLSRHFDLVHLEDAFSPSRRRSTGRPVACITFDDGYESNHALAFPVLERFQAPATIFLVPDLVDTQSSIWSARLHNAICSTSAGSVSHEGFRFSLGSTSARARASAILQGFLKTLPREALEPSLLALIEKLGQREDETFAPGSPYRILGTDQIRQMASSGLVRFGGHSCRHDILSNLSDDDLNSDLDRCIRAVSKISGTGCRTFAYPNGALGDFDARVERALMERGIELAVTTVPGPNCPDESRTRLRRYGIGDIDTLTDVVPRVRHLEWLWHPASRRSVGI